MADYRPAATRVARKYGIPVPLFLTLVKWESGGNQNAVSPAGAVGWTQLMPEEILESPYVLVGTEDRIVEDLQARRERWGISYVTTHELFMDALAPIVARLVGR